MSVNDPHTNDITGLGLHAQNDKKQMQFARTKGDCFIKIKEAFMSFLLNFFQFSVTL